MGVWLDMGDRAVFIDDLDGDRLSSVFSGDKGWYDDLNRVVLVYVKGRGKPEYQVLRDVVQLEALPLIGVTARQGTVDSVSLEPLPLIGVTEGQRVTDAVLLEPLVLGNVTGGQGATDTVQLDPLPLFGVTGEQRATDTVQLDPLPLLGVTGEQRATDVVQLEALPLLVPDKRVADPGDFMLDFS